MSANAIVYPAIAMFFLTLAMLLNMGRSRFRAVAQGEVSIRHFRLYNEGEEPAWLRKASRHAHNHFETPPLFYIAVLFLYVTGSVSLVAVGLAWAYVVARCVHSAIHLGSNNVNHRFAAFSVSLLAQAGLWLCLLVALLRAA